MNHNVIAHADAPATADANATASASAHANANANANGPRPRPRLRQRHTANADAHANFISGPVNGLGPVYARAFAYALAHAYAHACDNAQRPRLRLRPLKDEPMKQSYTLHFSKGYIAHPYTIELEKVINIEKQSGMNRARSEANRAKALTEYLTKQGMTNDDYLQLKKLAERPFYTDGGDQIVIPENQIYGMLAQGSEEARAATRVASRDQIRTTLTVLGPLRTGKTKADGIYERFATPTSGTGAKLSNQRALRSNPYIADFSTKLEVEFDDAHVDAGRVRNFIDFCGREIGLGASRKMGWGRFVVK